MPYYIAGGVLLVGLGVAFMASKKKPMTANRRRRHSRRRRH
jgi:hypothetical protein